MDAVRCAGVWAEDGSHGAVEDLTWAVPAPAPAGRGTAVTVLGAPRCGPSVVLRLMVGLARPTRGRVELLGHDTTDDATAARRHCGYLPADFRIPSECSGLGLLSHLADLRGVDLPTRGLELAERLQLDLDRDVDDLSGSERRKLGVVQALMTRPPVLLLDEPIRGLGAADAARVCALVGEAVAEGAVVLVADHGLGTARCLADRVLVLHEGRLVLDSPAGPLLERVRREVEVELSDPAAAVDFARSSPLSDVAVAGSLVRGVVTGDVDDVVKAAARHHTVRLVTHEPDMTASFWAARPGPLGAA